MPPRKPSAVSETAPSEPETLGTPDELEAELAELIAVPAEQRTDEEVARVAALLRALSPAETPSSFHDHQQSVGDAFGVNTNLADEPDDELIVGTVVAAVGTSHVGFPNGVEIDVDPETGRAISVRRP